MDEIDRHCGGLGLFRVRLRRWLVLWLMVLTTEHTEYMEIFNLFFSVFSVISVVNQNWRCNENKRRNCR
jgi:hypothetical protein